MRGFNLIETMVVVAIVGIVAALAVPKLLPEIHKAQLDGDAEAAANFIARARAEAMYSKRCTRVRVTNAGPTTGTNLVAETVNSFDCDSATPALNTTLDGANQFLQFDSLHTSTPNVQWSFASADGGTTPFGITGNASNELRFRPNGRIWFAGALAASPGNMNTDGAVLTVKHLLIINQNELQNAALAGTRRVVVQGNGLTCVLDRGQTAATEPRLCPLQ